MTLEEMKAIVDEAHRMGKRVAAHAEGLEGTRWALEAGADTIEHGLALHREPVLLDDMAERGTVWSRRCRRSTTSPSGSRTSSRRCSSSRRKRQLEEALRTVETRTSRGRDDRPRL
jgi:imidazolonepropionase-like amidohydrolase